MVKNVNSPAKRLSQSILLYKMVFVMQWIFSNGLVLQRLCEISPLKCININEYLEIATILRIQFLKHQISWHYLSKHNIKKHSNNMTDGQ